MKNKVLFLIGLIAMLALGIFIGRGRGSCNYVEFISKITQMDETIVFLDDMIRAGKSLPDSFDREINSKYGIQEGDFMNQIFYHKKSDYSYSLDRYLGNSVMILYISKKDQYNPSGWQIVDRSGSGNSPIYFSNLTTGQPSASVVPTCPKK